MCISMRQAFKWSLQSSASECISGLQRVWPVLHVASVPLLHLFDSGGHWWTMVDIVPVGFRRYFAFLKGLVALASEMQSR